MSRKAARATGNVEGMPAGVSAEEADLCVQLSNIPREAFQQLKDQIFAERRKKSPPTGEWVAKEIVRRARAMGILQPAFEVDSQPTSTYRPRPTNGRRTKAEIEELKSTIYTACATHQPLTVRNLFYLLVSAGHVEKTEQSYKNIVIRLAGLMREEGELPWDWLVDSTRWMRKPRSYTGLEDLLARSAQLYRRDLWAQSEEYVEIWCESESIAGVIYSITAEYDVPLMAARGFSSKPFLFDAAATIADNDKPTTIYYLGDYDPSGVVARNDVCERLNRYLEEWHDFSNEFDFVPLAITTEQIQMFDLPTRPPKAGRNTHARSLGWGEDQGTVEAEALDPDHLRVLLRNAIEQHLPAGEFERLRAIEQEERRTLERIRFELAEEQRA